MISIGKIRWGKKDFQDVKWNFQKIIDKSMEYN